jgi:sterol desaturase/sphingolipid hydroxylase (fatty acid hydroxylase superfamily)
VSRALAATGLGWLVFITGGLGAVYAGISLGQAGELSLNVATATAGVMLLGLERVWPEQSSWVTWDSESWHDLGHFFVGFSLGAFGGAALAQGLVPEPIWAIWPSTWPLVAQVLLGLVLIEFFLYWQHRAVHTFPALWHLHMLHHNATRMTFFKTTRIHALDIGSATLLSMAPLLAIGAPVQVLLWVTAFGNFAAQTQHANVRLRTPAWLNRVVGTPATHWLHHSLDLREGNSNFGMNVMVWDHVFGTYLPPPAEPRIVLGIAPDPVPASFVGQLLLPLRAIRDLIRRT